MKKSIIIFMLIAVLSIIPACQQAQDNGAETATVNLYYGDSNNEKMATEERQIMYERDEDKYVESLKELVKGPEKPEYTANINPETVIYGTIKQNKDVIVNFSEHFAQFGGSMAELFGVGSVVNTLTQFQEVDRVKILVEGNELVGPSGEPRGFMEAFPTEANLVMVTLYFADQQATAVIAESREIAASSDREQFIALVLEELIKGPKSENLSATIPKTVKVQSVSIENALAEIDFSEEMHTDHWGGATGEAMTLNSIANTLFEFDYIDEIMMTVNEEIMNIEHVVIEEPLPRN